MHEICESAIGILVVYFVVDSNKNNVVYHRKLYQPMSFKVNSVGGRKELRGERFV